MRSAWRWWRRSLNVTASRRGASARGAPRGAPAPRGRGEGGGGGGGEDPPQGRPGGDREPRRQGPRRRARLRPVRQADEIRPQDHSELGGGEQAAAQVADGGPPRGGARE